MFLNLAARRIVCRFYTSIRSVLEKHRCWNPKKILKAKCNYISSVQYTKIYTREAGDIFWSALVLSVFHQMVISRPQPTTTPKSWCWEVTCYILRCIPFNSEIKQFQTQVTQTNYDIAGFRATSCNFVTSNCILLKRRLTYVRFCTDTLKITKTYQIFVRAL